MTSNLKQRFEEKFVERLHPTGVRAVQSQAEDLEAFFQQELLALAEEVNAMYDLRVYERERIEAFIRAKATELN